MNIQQYIEIVEHNARVIKKQLKTRKTNLSDIIFWEGIRGRELPFDKLCAKAYDILGCAAMGGIPLAQQQGADGMIIDPINKVDFLEFESKLSAIERKYIYIGPRGGLYWSSNPENYNSKASLVSHFAGSFDIKMSEKTKKSKERWTGLVCFDRDKNTVIDQWLLPPKRTLIEINEREFNKSINIKLSRFLKHGINIEGHLPTIGWEKWYLTVGKLAIKEGRLI